MPWLRPCLATTEHAWNGAVVYCEGEVEFPVDLAANEHFSAEQR